MRAEKYSSLEVDAMEGRQEPGIGLAGARQRCDQAALDGKHAAFSQIRQLSGIGGPRVAAT